MAKLSAHGKEIDRREYPSCRVAVMADGHILRNYGQGWKLWKRIKAGIDPTRYASDARQRYEQRDPLFHEYVRVIRDAVALEHRNFLNEAVKLMPNDPDGVWSHMNDMMRADVDLDDCVTLCRLRQAAESLIEAA